LQSVARSVDCPIWADQVHTVPCVEIEAAGTKLGVEFVVGERGVWATINQENYSYVIQ
jgi:hypothetical protein